MIPFNKPFITNHEKKYIAEVLSEKSFSGNGKFTRKCEEWLEVNLNCEKALLTSSCTHALEMAAILINTKPGDEIIMPSYTFVSTANAFVLRGGVPVFIDIRPDTLNIDEEKIEIAITPRTKAIVLVHYAGVACEMDKIMEITKRNNLYLIEDNAHGILSTYNKKKLGSFGHLATLSFHETKNITSGEGGALLINDKKFIARAEIIREKGTDRSKFLRGHSDKYTWRDIGSSYLVNEMTAAFLYAQLKSAEIINKARLNIWDSYQKAFQQLKRQENIRLPSVPHDCQHNAHLYYLILNCAKGREKFMVFLKKMGIITTFHYMPLHNSLAGKQYCKKLYSLEHTEQLSRRIVRLPLWLGLEKYQQYIIRIILSFDFRDGI